MPLAFILSFCDIIMQAFSNCLSYVISTEAFPINDLGLHVETNISKSIASICSELSVPFIMSSNISIVLFLILSYDSFSLDEVKSLGKYSSSSLETFFLYLKENRL